MAKQSTQVSNFEPPKMDHEERKAYVKAYRKHHKDGALGNPGHKAGQRAAMASRRQRSTGRK